MHRRRFAFLSLAGGIIGLLLLLGLVGAPLLRPASPAPVTATSLARPVPTRLLPLGSPRPTGGPAPLTPPPTLRLPEAQATAVGQALAATAAADARLHPPTPPPRPLAPPSVFLTQDPRALSSPLGLRGPPPFAVPLAAFIVRDEADPTGCQRWQWDWGDGTRAEFDCGLLPQTAYGRQPGVVAQHTYPVAGIFTVTAAVVLTDGRQFPARPQQVIVSPYLPTPADPTWRNGVVYALSLLGLLGILLGLRRLPRRVRQSGGGLVLLFVLTYLPPVSYLPNPFGALWSVAGGYRYDPRLPFRNGFVILDDPTRSLADRLDTLIGQTGLDPLDPQAALIGYEFQAVTLISATQTRVQARMIYADGTTRTYDLPVYGARPVYREYRYASWLDDGLGRVSAAHRDLSGILPAREEGPIHLGLPTRLPLSAAAHALDTTDDRNWLLPQLEFDTPPQRLVPSPQGDRFLLVSHPDGRLWQVPLAGGAPVALTTDIAAYGWTPDGTGVVTVGAGSDHPIRVLSLDGTLRRSIAYSLSAALPGITAAGFWYAVDRVGHITPFLSGDEIVVPLSGPPPLGVVRPRPDGQQIAYRCADHWCIQARGGSAVTALPGGGNEAVWSPDGRYLALAGPQLLLYDSQTGQVVRTLSEELGGSRSQLTWTPDSRYLLVAFFPQGARRVVAVDPAGAGLWELSRPHWDSWVAPLPTGQGLLVGTGRGGFWQVPLLESAPAQ